MPIPDDARFGPDCDPQSRREDVAYEYPMGPTTLAEEKAMQGWIRTELGLRPPPYPRQTAGTANNSGGTNGTSTP